jgi:hypothetical protein
LQKSSKKNHDKTVDKDRSAKEDVISIDLSSPVEAVLIGGVPAPKNEMVGNYRST